MNYLVTGGAGYIGSHMVKYLVKKNHMVTVFDNYSTGHYKKIKGAVYKKIDLINLSKLDSQFSKYKFDAVFHFAALSIVSDSEKKPKKYFKNNVIGTKNLIKTMIKYSSNNFVFSSSASVYGKPHSKKISEKHQTKPISNYGKNKKKIEEILIQAGKKYNFKSISLRYFNAAGADKSGEIGESHKPETHLIPKILKSIIERNYNVTVYGKNHKTKDGTCIRDYVHVNDIVRAHYFILKKFKKKKCSIIYNIGSGRGYSVLEIIKSIEKITKKKLNIIFEKKKKGDPPILVAKYEKISKETNWKPIYSQIQNILLSAWNWHKKEKLNSLNDQQTE